VTKQHETLDSRDAFLVRMAVLAPEFAQPIENRRLAKALLMKTPTVRGIRSTTILSQYCDQRNGYCSR
jgi:hypothetical protein